MQGLRSNTPRRAEGVTGFSGLARSLALGWSRPGISGAVALPGAESEAPVGGARRLHLLTVGHRREWGRRVGGSEGLLTDQGWEPDRHDPLTPSKPGGLVLVQGVLVPAFGCWVAGRVWVLVGRGSPASRARQRDRQERVAGTGCFQRREVSRKAGTDRSGC
jgi:hypothetical protein